MGTWPDQVQGFGQAFRFPWFELKQASVQVSFPASHHVGHAHLVWIDLERLEPTEARLEGEGTALWEDDLARGGSRAGVPSKVGACFPSLETHGKTGPVCESVSFSRSRPTSRAPEPSRARGRACSEARAWSSESPRPGLAWLAAVPEAIMGACSDSFLSA